MPDVPEQISKIIAQADALIAQARESLDSSANLIRTNDIDPEQLVANAHKRLGPQGQAEFQALLDAELLRLQRERDLHPSRLEPALAEAPRRARKLHRMV